MSNRNVIKIEMINIKQVHQDVRSHKVFNIYN